MRFHLTFSNFGKKVSTHAPVLPFTLTFELINDEGQNIFQLTLPGCLFVPKDEGVDGLLGKFQPPLPYNKRGHIIPPPLVKPDALVKHIEERLRTHSEVNLWTKKIQSAFSTDPEERTKQRRQLLGR